MPQIIYADKMRVLISKEGNNLYIHITEISVIKRIRVSIMCDIQKIF